MMKKLLILLLALSMTSACYALAGEVTITVNDQPYTGQDVKGSDIIKVVWNTPAQVFGGYSALTYDVSIGDYEADSFSTLATPSPLIANTLAPGDTGAGMNITGGTSGMPHPAGWLFEFEFHVPYDLQPSTIIVLDATAGGFTGQTNAAPGPDDVWPYTELHVIPEPMTIALLGLGGLFLRRRK
jgi:hypothetical protein